VKSNLVILVMLVTSSALAEWKINGDNYYYSPKDTIQIESKFNKKYPAPSKNHPSRKVWLKHKSNYIKEQIISEMVLTAPKGVIVSGKVKKRSDLGYHFTNKTNSSKTELNSNGQGHSALRGSQATAVENDNNSQEKFFDDIKRNTKIPTRNVSPNKDSFPPIASNRVPSSSKLQCTQSDLADLAADYQKTKKILEDMYKKELKESGCEE
jgi:hypothetical protein